MDAGVLRSGPWDPAADGFDQRNLWRTAGDHVVIRIPWAMAGMADPSSRLAFARTGDDDRTPTTVAIRDLPLTVTVGDETVALAPAQWEPWQRVYHRERLEDGAELVAEAMVETSRP